MSDGLTNLKDVLKGKDEDENYFQWFDRIANVLFNEVALVSNCNKKYRLGEIEFYYYSSEHEDVFSHKHEYQRTNGNLYLHGSGMDITFGNQEKNAYGGILIRALIDDDNNNLIEGSINASCELVLPSKKSQFQNKDMDKLLQTDKKNDKLEFYRSPRVGLKLDQNTPNDENAQKFIMMPYRYTLKMLIDDDNYDYPGNYDKKQVIQVWNAYLNGDQVIWGNCAQCPKRQNYINIYNQWCEQYGEEVKQILESNSNLDKSGS